MADIIRQRRVASDNWQLLEAAADGASLAIAPDGDIIVPLSWWLARREALLARAGRLGVWLNSHEDPALIAADLRHFALIAVHFPQFTDGRGHSLARLLRERYNWRGELRAIGDVFRDPLYYLERCGFDSFALRPGEDAQAALSAFDDFSEAYQTAVDRRQPLFRRRFAASHHAMAVVTSPG